MRLRRACGPVLLTIVAAFAAPLPTTAQALSPYDDFSSTEIDGRRWDGYTHTVRFADLVQLAGGWNNQVENHSVRHPRFSTSNATSVRRVVGSQLQLRLESLGGTHPDPNVAPGHGRLGLTGWGSRNIVQARITPVAAETPACRTTGESRVRAQLVADLLGTDPAYGGPDRTDVFATLSLDRSSFRGDQIYAVVSRCRDWTCNVAEDLDWVVFNRGWTLGRAHTLTIRHEPETSRVVFTVAGGGVAAETRVLRSLRSTENTYVGSSFGLRVETTPAHCPAAGAIRAERIGVTMDARFDDVRVGAP
jgi:hypothetical protein